uniref:non-specific serine/threonine protein kinase n=1 Tax=Salmo trutta TaxID=8032 RepID=A0A674C9R6_SALTR
VLPGDDFGCFLQPCLFTVMEKYEKIKVVGRGAFGDERLNAQNECQVLKLLNHHNIIEYYENFLEDKALMIAMEYAPSDYIQKHCNSLLDEDIILHFLVQILLTLYHVHNKLILHRKLKTQNILLDKHQMIHQMIVKTGDFGISTSLSARVVGAPCCISPELCEGKPYNQKSDIWTLGCVLYELNLPALVLKIMSGTFAPISDRYSPELRQLIMNMLNLDPSKRPQLNEIMAHPVCIKPLLNLFTDIGNVKMCRIEKPLSTVQSGGHGKPGERMTSTRSFRDGQMVTGKLHSLSLSSVYTLGSEVLQVAVGRTQKMGVTKSGRLITWEALSVGSGEPTLPGAVKQTQPQFSSRFLEGRSGVTIKSVSCGDLFTTCMTERGVIMTFGSGSNGCLGHGELYELVQVSCDASHVLAVTNDREIFSWGRGDNGRLGLGTQDSHNSPQQVCVPGEFEAHRVLCGVDCSMVISTNNSILACGSVTNVKWFNKLRLDKINAAEEPAPCDQIVEVHSFSLVQSAPLNMDKVVYIYIGTTHSVAVTEKGQCYTFGSNQHGQLGCSSRRTSRVTFLSLQGITMAACGEAFTLAIGSGVISGERGLMDASEEKRWILGTPKAVQLDESHPFTVTSVACCHGNSLLAVKHNILPITFLLNKSM